ncbi:MAG: FtsX-like permease family protein [Oscillospiraceae bacterium]|nr:FtsX-like permease family protein [Oscillospiraceae bacterium]
MKMLKNNNGAILRKLTMRSLKSGKMRNIFIIITVALSAALISGLAGFALAMDKKEDRDLSVQPHVIYGDLSNNQVESIKNDERVEDIVRYKHGGSMEVENYEIRPSYFSDEGKIIASMRSDITEGSYPEKINEAVVSKEYMKKIGKEPVIGAEFSVTWLDGSTETYTVTGFNDLESESQFYIMLSEEYAENGSQLKDVSYTAASRIVGVANMDAQTFLNTIRGIGGEYGIPRHQISENSNFVIKISNIRASTLLAVIVISAAVLFVSVFVIYSIFYISVTGRIRQFGQLRTIGMTSKQIRKTVRYEGIFLSAMGSLIGILVGTAFAYFIVPKGFYLPNTLITAVLTIAATSLTVMFSVKKPAKIAAAASPIEAAKMNDNGGGTTSSKKGKRKLTPFGLAKISADSNRKKSAMTAVSLGIGGVIFVMGTTLIASYNIEEYSRVGKYHFGDYVLEISDNAVQTSEHGAADIQINNPLTKEIEAEIAAFDGVKKVTRYDRFSVQYEYNNYQPSDSVMPFESRYTDVMNKCRAEGEAFDYDKMVRNKEIIICNNDQALEIYGWKFETGDTVKLKWYDGYEYREDNFTVAGSFDIGKLLKLNDEDADYLTIGTGWFYIPMDLLKTMFPDEYDTSDGLVVEVEDYKTDMAVKEFLQKYADSDPHLRLTCFSDVVNNDKSNYYLVAGMVWGLSAFIIGFALINLINTLVSNIMSRKREFAMLCSIGMNGGQLKKMIIGEGLILAAKNIIITAVFGTAAGYVLIQIMREFAATYLHWHFPGWYILGYIAMVLIVPVLISAVITKILEKKTLVERLRESYL